MKYLAVAAGSALGGMLRHYLNGGILSRLAEPFPTATFFINVSGSFILGFFLTLATERFQLSDHLRLAVAVGFVGAYTTFSTFEYETLRLVEARGLALALLNVVLSVAVGFAAVWGGMMLARMFTHPPAPSLTRAERFERQADAAGDSLQRSGAKSGLPDATAGPPEV